MNKRLHTYTFMLLALGLLSGYAQAQSAPTTGETLTIPSMQMAVVQIANGGAEVLQYQSVPVLSPGKHQVLIKVVAAAINPIERRFREGGDRGPRPNDAPKPPTEIGGQAPTNDVRPQRPSGPSIPGILGGDLAGVVVKLGEGVSNVAIGDAVFAKLAPGQAEMNGAYSQYAIAPANQTNLKPSDQSFAEAAGLGTVGVTALRTIKHANVQAGQRVFINGIGGGIGSSAAQFALQRGAYVIGTASARHHEYLTSIGVNEIINYREVQFDEVIKEPVDVVIETVGTKTANQALNILKPGGRLVSISGPADPVLCEAKNINCSRIGGEFGWPNSVMLAEVAQLAESGAYRLNVDATFPLEQAGAAQDLNHTVGTSGKIILIVDPAMALQK